MVSIDTSRLRQRLVKLPAQVRFATAYMLTQLAKDGREAATKRIGEAFDRPVRFTQSAITISLRWFRRAGWRDGATVLARAIF